MSMPYIQGPAVGTHPVDARGETVLGSEQDRRALEALRSGVPNRDAVRALGVHQPAADMKFSQILADTMAAAGAGEAGPGMVVSGDFGAGKSHLLEHLQHRALESGFVVSRIAVSKETPLYDLAKVYKSAIINAELPHKTGPAVAELAFRLDPKRPSYTSFYKWANNPNSGLSSLFAASLFIHEQLRNNMDLIEKITDFWSGEPLAVTEIKSGLVQCNAASTYTVTAVKASDMAYQRFLFMSHLIQGAGYAGWILLFDEVELIGRYSLLQRARSYAEVARWANKGSFPGVGAVLAVTADYSLLMAEKEDSMLVGAKLRDRGDHAAAILADAGMSAINASTPLDAPTHEVLGSLYARIKQLHAHAYAWAPPEVETSEFRTNKAMRVYIRRWINEWDLKRLYPDAVVDLVEEDVKTDYSEDPVLEEGPSQA